MAGEIEIGGRFGRLYQVLDWAYRLAVVNLLWIAGVLAGLVIAGLAPATVAASWLLLEYCRGNRPRPWHGFWRQWRDWFLPAQLGLGVPLATVFVLGFYLVTVASQAALEFRAVAVSLAILSAAYLATLSYLPAVLCHVGLGPVAAWRTTVLAAWRQPVITLALLVAQALLVVGMAVVLPAALPFFAYSGPALLATRAALRAFGR
ncbi:YesL family protein [Nonomuraea sp. 10N515B]|uniref:YesL family protein n=1 Tax=Nonomuraea sp. 10N515B TaxID=3457422 RepID=UPI003FCC6D39